MRASKYVKESMDDSVDPCNDFYTFACGGFNTKAVIADDKNSFTTIDAVREKMEEQVRKNTNKAQSDSEFYFGKKEWSSDFFSCPDLERVGSCWRRKFWRRIQSRTRCSRHSSSPAWTLSRLR